ncbi:hypothetical protein like AT5G67130 [Hibiscus trionum]|uniref:Uncharacterized protein n=1 Tax=Hibiscus trionum TaxID=183268 RepID=A0A9W7H140_HIBTR|nr:hypothetical protein like AT5G67130 [Hibiscus trionum]
MRNRPLFALSDDASAVSRWTYEISRRYQHVTDMTGFRGGTAVGFLFLMLLASSFKVSSSYSIISCQGIKCGPGYRCGSCPALGKPRPFCMRGKATIPTTVIGNLPFNKYSWLATHNSFSNTNAPLVSGVQRVTFYNQDDTVTTQLMNGVRGLMLDMYDFKGDVWLCHSPGGFCFSHTAFQPAINTLKEVEAFLARNPTEIVTIIIEDNVRTPHALTKLFTNAGLKKYWFPVSKMPQNGEDWPTVNQMVQLNHRLLVFSSVATKETREGIGYQWKYFLENEAGDAGLRPGRCPNRKESKPLNSKTASLVLMNFYTSLPSGDVVCKEHSAPLADMIRTCYRAAANRMPNFVAVDFYLRSGGGGVFDALDVMNGQGLCGCNNISACQPGRPFGSCKKV